MNFKESLTGQYELTYRYKNQFGVHKASITGSNKKKLLEMFNNLAICGKLIGYKIIKFHEYDKRGDCLLVEIVEDNNFDVL
jgi:hypothetical protein